MRANWKRSAARRKRNGNSARKPVCRSTNGKKTKRSVKWELKPKQRAQSVSLAFFNPNASSGEFLRNTKFPKKTKIPSFFFIVFSFTELWPLWRATRRQRLPMDFCCNLRRNVSYDDDKHMTLEPNFDRFRRNCRFSRVSRARSRMHSKRGVNRIRLQRKKIAPITTVLFDFQSRLDGSWFRN